MYVFYVVFFFKQKTAYEMRISDWSSDVCSSDLLFDMRRFAGAVKALDHHPAILCKAGQNRHGGIGIEHVARVQIGDPLVLFGKGRDRHEIGRASCREGVCQYV